MLIVRQRLLGLLETAAPGTVVAVIAPAGYGKTSLLEQYAASGASTALLTLGPEHDDPARFVRDLSTALGLDLDALPAFGTGTFLDALVAAIDAPDSPETLVIDDMHHVTEPKVLEVIARVIWEVRTSRVIVASQRSPPIGLARLKVRRRLIELDDGDLALSIDETVELLRSLAPALDLDGLRTTIEETDGWPAGVILLGLALARGGSSAVAAMTARLEAHDFFRTEVYDLLPPDLADFVRELAVMRIFDTKMVERVSSHDDAALLVIELIDRRLFLEAVPRPAGTLRFHSLVADMLETDSVASLPAARVREIRRVVIEELIARGEFDAAIDRLVAIGDPHLVVELLAVRRPGPVRWLSYLLWTIGSTITVNRVLDAVNVEDLPESEAVLSSMIGMAVASENLPRATALRERLAALRPWNAADSHGLLASAEGAYALLCGDVPQMRAAYRMALDKMGGGRSADALPLYFAQCGDADALLHADQLDDAASSATLGIEHATRAGFTIYLPALHAIVGLRAVLDGPARTDDAEVALASAVAAMERSREPLDLTLVGALESAIAGANGDWELARRVALATINNPDAPSTGLAAALPLLLLANAELRVGHGINATARMAQVRALLQKTTGARLLERIAQGVTVDERRRGAGPFNQDTSWQLTPRERGLLRLLRTRMTKGEIASELYVSVNTVKTQTQSIYRKLGVSSRSEAIAVISNGR